MDVGVGEGIGIGADLIDGGCGIGGERDGGVEVEAMFLLPTRMAEGASEFFSAFLFCSGFGSSCVVSVSVAPTAIDRSRREV